MNYEFVCANTKKGGWTAFAFKLAFFSPQSFKSILLSFNLALLSAHVAAGYKIPCNLFKYLETLYNCGFFLLLCFFV